MPKFELTTVINAEPNLAFTLAQQVESFPRYAPDLKEVRILSKDGGVTRTLWVGKVELGPIVREVRWEEEDTWDAEKLSCEFKLVSGDMKDYFGSWTFSGTADGKTLCTLTVTYELGIPLLGALLEKLIHDRIVEASQSILDAVKRLAEETKA